MASALLVFPGERVAQFTVSFGATHVASLDLVGAKGMLRMDHAYSYSEELTRALTIDAKTRMKTFPVGDQFAPELIHFSDCIRTGKRPEPDGAEGLADIRIVESIFKSAASGRAVKIAPIKSPKLMNPSQAIKRPPVREPKLVKVKPPHKGK